MFPDIPPTGDYSWSPVAFDQRETAADGSTQISVPHPKIQRRFTANWEVLELAELWQIYTHWAANRSNAFTLFDFWYLPWTDVAVGTGDGATTTFTLPAKEVTGIVVKVAGVVQGGGTYTLSAGTGAEGEDRILFNVAPANGAAITYSATRARARFTVLYATPELRDMRNVEADIWRVSASFLETV